MDQAQLAASLQALMDQQKAAAQRPAPVAPVQPDVLVASVPEVTPEFTPEPDPFFEQYFVQATPAGEQTALVEPYVEPYVFDDDLLEDQEEAAAVKVTNVANAAYRAKRTGIQGLIVSVVIAAGGVLTALQVDAEIDWKLVGISLGQAVLTAVVSFLHNDKSASADSE
ncbi:hypothetical protein GCM10022419_016170 [Nonomuraea rosea]|uniref:DUF2335 domain-containing protein n=1 Tax=Nonomuraea rosea TaxID=638574 RepID=A0ABP6VLD6_9ACTN